MSSSKKPEELPIRKSQPSPGHWAEPENYGKGNLHLFMRGEVALIHREGRGVKHYSPPSYELEEFPVPTSSKVLPFDNQPRDMTISGVRGCTVVLVISKRGALLFHFWEYPSFTGRIFSEVFSDYNVDNNAEPEHAKEKRFSKDVLEALEKRGSNHCHEAGIQDCRSATAKDPDLTQYRNLFDDEAEPKAFIMTPLRYKNDTHRHRLHWHDHVERIKDKITGIFNPYVLPLEIVKYTPLEPVNVWQTDKDDRAFKAPVGKILVQYQPRSTAENPPVELKKSKYRVWFEGEAPKGTMQAEW